MSSFVVSGECIAECANKKKKDNLTSHELQRLLATSTCAVLSVNLVEAIVCWWRPIFALGMLVWSTQRLGLVGIY